MNSEKQPIRVAQIIGKWVGGGVESFIMNYYRNIDRNKIQFDFICDEDSTDIPYDEIKKMGGEVILVPPYQKLFKYQKKLNEIFKNKKYKIIHSHINTLSIFPLRIAKKNNIPIRIAHSHSTTNKTEWKKNLIKNLLKGLSKIYATDYFACSELAGRFLFGDKTYDNGKVVIIRNAIDINKYIYSKEKRENKRRELEINDNTIVIGNIGRFVEQKNHDFLIDIFEEVHNKNKNSILVLIGQGPLIQKIKNKVDNKKLENCVYFLGQKKDVNEWYQAFDTFVLPSLYEGLGMVLIEAQISGLPCVCSTEVPKEVKEIQKFKFVDLKSDSKVWAKYILDLNKNNNRISYKEEFLNKGYDIKKEAKRLEKIYLTFFESLRET